MKHKYTAKVYLEDEEMIENTGNDLDQLKIWMQGQAEATYSEIRGEIIDNNTHKVIDSMEYSPPED